MRPRLHCHPFTAVLAAGFLSAPAAFAQDAGPEFLPAPESVNASATAAPAEPPAPPVASDKPADKPTAAVAAAKKDADAPPPNPWAKIPPVAPLPRLGQFLLPPKGPAYYSLADQIHHELREKPFYPFGPYGLYGRSTFDWDFRYLDKPDNTNHDWSDCLKRIHPCDDVLFSTGGELRYRFNNEVDSRLTNRDNVYDLTRVRVYGDLWYKDEYRVFVEFIDARSFNQDLPPLLIDDTGADLLNAFVEVKAGELAGQPVYIRAGRQELLYGSQRLISTLDWGNTRRTFEGAKAYWHSEKVDVDLFWTRPVVPDPDRFDSSDANRNFAGLWATLKPKEGTTVDAYLLNLSRSLPANRGDVFTLGGRSAGDKCDGRLLYDFELAYQFGDRGGKTVKAFAGTGGLGYRMKDVPFNPQFWIYYDHASGNRNPDNVPVDNTFDPLFPFGHYYLGYVDVVGRQNIHDLNVQAAFWPTAWIVSLIQIHSFRLDSATDALYSDSGAMLRRDRTGRAGTDVGTEIDFYTNFHLSNHQDILFGYSKLYAGDFIKATGPNVSPEFFYAQYTIRY
jgi:hypothetical protein